MKNVVRALALALVATGAVASTMTASAATSAKATLAPNPSALPVATCPPDDPNACGIGQMGR